MSGKRNSPDTEPGTSKKNEPSSPSEAENHSPTRKRRKTNKGKKESSDGQLGQGKKSRTRQKIAHNLHNRRRLRAISDSINTLRLLIESDGTRIGPLKLDILDAAVKSIREKQLNDRDRSYKSNMAGASHYQDMFENSDQMALLVLVQSTDVSIVNASDTFLELTGWSREFLVSKPYSLVSNKEPQHWIVHYRLLITDPTVKELRLNNLILNTADGAVLVVNMRVVSLKRRDEARSTFLSVNVISAGDASMPPSAQLLYNADVENRPLRRM